MRDLSDRNETVLPNRNQLASVSNSALHISTLQRFGAPRFLLDENNAGGAAAGAGAGAGGNAAAGDGGGSGGGGAGSGAGAGAGAGDAGAGGAGAAGGQSGQGGGGPSAYRPDGLPDHYFGGSDKETIDKLFTAVNGFRTKQGDAGAVPANADAYAFEASDTLKPFVQNFDKDPVYKAVRELALKAGVTDKQFKSFIPGVLEHFVSADLVAAPIDPKAMLRDLAPASMATANDAEKETAGAKRVQDNIAWIDGAKSQGAMPEGVADFFAAAAAGDPRAHAAIEWLRGDEVEVKPAMNGAGSGSGGPSDADLEARLNDPRNRPGAPEFSQAFATETDNLYKKRYG